MQISISTRHGHLSDESRNKITAKVEKLSRLFERLTAIEITVDLERPESPQVDLRVSAEHKHDFVANDRSSDLMSSIDSAVHKLEQQLRKYKDKIQNHHRTPKSRDQVVPAEPETGSE